MIAVRESSFSVAAPLNRGEARLPAAVLPLVAVLRQLAELLGAMTDEQYVAKPVGAMSGSIGGHVRHCLDHVDALLAGVERKELNYDDRKRGTAVETSRQAALEALGRQEWQLLAFPRCPENRPLRLTTLVSTAAPPVAVTTTVGRELAFVLSHTIHHKALIGVLARTLCVPVPEGFGYAPSTLAHREKAACVR